MRKGPAFFVVAIVAVVGGYFGGRILRRPSPEGEQPTVAQHAAPTPAAPAAPMRPMVGNEVYKVEVGKAPITGARQPKVTLIEFSDFECPFCSRMTDTVHRLLKEFPNDLAVAFKHFPLPMHPNALPAAIAA